MLSPYLVLCAGLIWLGLLFAVAVWGERRSHLLHRHWHWIYALSLAVYCTSWTFYGTVTQAARSGWPVPPTFIGTILLYVFGLGLLRRLIRLARAQHSSSLADLIATRLGKDARLAAAVTAVAVFGMLPYMALQLKAVAMSYGMLTQSDGVLAAPWQDSALYVALGMAVFAMLFGARRAVATEHNHGLVLAMAFESLLKLSAMLMIGAFVLFGLPALPALEAPLNNDSSGFLPLIILGVLAMFTLPHQFHVGVVECRDEQHLRTARWLFPMYMLLIALPLLPLARAGSALFAGQAVPSDLYVLALPLSQGQDALALLAFLGGLSAATGMIILATLALSVMIGNHWLAPLLVRNTWVNQSGSDLRGLVLAQRRIAILVLLLLAWLYSRALAGNDALADIGAVSFSALATLAPALAYAIWRPQTSPGAVMLGLLAASLAWIWILLLPLLGEAVNAAWPWLQQGPFDIAWLAPDAMFGLDDWSRVGRAVLLSLSAGTVLPWLLSWLQDRSGQQAATNDIRPLNQALLRKLAARFLPAEQLRTLFAGHDSADIEDQVETALAQILGAASARLLLKTARDRHHNLDDVVELVDETSAALRFNQQLLEAALENMSQGISVVNSDLQLMAWNRRYAEMFGFPDELLQIGRPIIELQRWAIEHGFAGDIHDRIEVMLQRRLRHMRAGNPHLTERKFPDGSMVEVRGNPMPGGGYVATFTDVTEFHRSEQRLQDLADTLEKRVHERTAELSAAKSEAERANRAKSRFLAAISHDVFQPLGAAQLFTHNLAQQLAAQVDKDSHEIVSVRNIYAALQSVENLLGSCQDLSKLESGRLQPLLEDFALEELLDGLVLEYSALAREKGLRLRHVPTSQWVHSDRQLLRRIIQNYLANAIRYTASGEVLLGCRRLAGAVSVQVLDTGPGIAPDDQPLVFEEFQRLAHGKSSAEGLGLGLAIVRGIADLLDYPLQFQSMPGAGTLFGVQVPVAQARCSTKDPAGSMQAMNLRVLCIDDDAATLQSEADLLQSWGCQTMTADGWHAALQQVSQFQPHLLLVDYHLQQAHEDDTTRRNGLELIGVIRKLLDREIPAVIVTGDRSDDIRASVLAAEVQYLNKPLRPMALRALLQQASHWQLEPKPIR